MGNLQETPASHLTTLTTRVLLTACDWQKFLWDPLTFDQTLPRGTFRVSNMKSEQKLSQTRSQQNLAFEFLTTVVTSSYCNNPKTSLPLTNLMTPPSYLNMVTQKPIRRPSGGRLRSAADADVTISTVYRQHVIFRACYCAKKITCFEPISEEKTLSWLGNIWRFPEALKLWDKEGYF